MLKDYRRKLVTADAMFKVAFQDSALLLVLCRSLPESFTTTIDIISAQHNLTIMQKLRYLEEKEVRNQQNAAERAQAVFQKTSKNVSPQKYRSHKASLSFSGFGHSTKSRPKCRLCNGGHFLRECPNIEKARDLLIEYKAQTNKKILSSTNSSKLPTKATVSKRNKETDEAYGA